jgi:hypothetical protein
LFFSGIFFLLCLNFLQVIVEAIEGLFPELAIALEPMGGILEGLDFEATGTPLGLPAAGDQAGVLEDFQVLGDCWESHLERPGEVVDRGFAAAEMGEDGTARGIGKGGESGGEVVLCGLHCTDWLINRMV